MVHYIKKEKPKMRVREQVLPASENVLLGEGIDVTKLPEGHLACWRCKGYKFECSLQGDNFRVECGCISCNEAYRLLFPITCPMPEQKGRFTCHRHPDKAMIVIHNVGYLSIGCELCKTQIIFKIQEGLIIPEGGIN